MTMRRFLTFSTVFVAAFVALVLISGCSTGTPTSPSGSVVVPDDFPEACKVVRMEAHIEARRTGQSITNWGRNELPTAVATAFNASGKKIYQDASCVAPMPYEWGEVLGPRCNVEGDSGAPRQDLKCYSGGEGSLEVCMRRDNRTKGVCTNLRFHVLE